MKIKMIILCGLLITLTACGTDPKDRTQGGAATGATAGATIGMWGGPPGMLLGAFVGGGLGALSGATIPEENIDLGDPIWKNK